MTTPTDAIDGLSERLRKTLACVEPDDFRGDNLAIFIASELEPSIEDETLDDSMTWKQGALDACDRVLDAIHAHYATAIDALQARVKELEAKPPLLDAQSLPRVDALIQALESRALRAKQERDEAYERAAKVAETHEPQHELNTSIARQIGRNIAAAIRRLAGPEKEGE